MTFLTIATDLLSRPLLLNLSKDSPMRTLCRAFNRLTLVEQAILVELWGILDRMPTRVPDRCHPVMIVIKQLTRAVILVMAAVFIGVLLSR